MMTDWLRDHLVAAGHLTESGLGRKARLRKCPKLIGQATRGVRRRRCGQLILAGLDAERCALEAVADPAPLSALGEAIAWVEGRRTWTLRREGGGYVLDPRSQLEITRYPATSQPRADVLRQHQCGTPSVPDELAAPSCFARAPIPADAKPPF